MESLVSIGFDDFGRRVKGGRKEKSAKEIAALARLQQNYGFLLNPESVMGQFDDSLEEKKSTNFQSKDGKEKSDNNTTSTKSHPSSARYVAPKGKEEERKGREERKSRSRSRDNRRERGNGSQSQRYHNQDRERDSRREEGRPRDRSRERDRRR